MAACPSSSRPEASRPRPNRPLQPTRWPTLRLAVSVVALVLAAGLSLAAPAHSAPPAQRGIDPVHTPTRAATDFTFLIAYSFGNRIPSGVDPTRTVGEPGPVNEALADAAVRTRGDRSIPIYAQTEICLLYTSPSPRDGLLSRMPSSA